ncbi:nitrogenase component 1 [Clostridium sp. HV4-5-A1G]|uniref:nitrogenase component 1 n=1 Tax=Clostridium sp. HV4-5-A1G TaxID=2004595 RepID=UPI001687A4A3|nr:nitrogenase component 1 [Clostridium sp. HV4-5-A1G]
MSNSIQQLKLQEVESDKRVLESPKYTCALGGALSVITNIYRAIPIINSGIGCGMNQMMRFRRGGGHQGVGYIGGLSVPSTNLSERDIVFGGETRLREEIRSTIDLIDGDFYFVANGCIAGMIGDDVEGIVSEFSDEPTPVLYVNSSGFMGNTYFGYEAVFEAAINQLIEPLPKEKRLVNILGFVPYQDIFWRGNLREIRRLLNKIGLRTNQVIGDFSGLEGLKKLSAAEYTIVVSPWVGRKTAKLLKEKFDIPYINFPNIPVGPRDSSEFLRIVGEKLGISKSKIEDAIAEEEREAYEDLNIIGDTCTRFVAALPFAIVSGSAMAVGITRFLTNEVSCTPKLVIVNDDPPADTREKILERLRNLGDESTVAKTGGISPKVIFEIDSYKIHQYLRDTYFRVLFASSQERYEAESKKQIHLSVTFPAGNRVVIRDTYTGYGGGISLIEDFLSKFVRP